MSIDHVTLPGFLKGWISMKLQFRDGTGWYVRCIEAVEFLGTGVRIIVLGFNVISDEAIRNTQAVLAFEILHLGSQSPPAALNKGVFMLSSRILRKCIKPGSVYHQNHHRIVSLYFQNNSTCLLLYLK